MEPASCQEGASDVNAKAMKDHTVKQVSGFNESLIPFHFPAFFFLYYNSTILTPSSKTFLLICLSVQAFNIFGKQITVMLWDTGVRV